MTKFHHLSRTATAALLAAAAVPLFAVEPNPEGGRKLTAMLTGAAEVPGPGDADGAGSFTARVNPGQGQVCYTLTVSAIDSATAAHIHTGAAGIAGPVAVALTAPSSGTSEACVTVSRELAMALIQTPQDYYVNVHNAAYPQGAVRGQLLK